MADVFVSYKKEDRALAQRVISALNADGFSVWWDDRIIPAEQWDVAIESQIKAAKAVIVLWTPASVKSSWVRSEAEVAKSHNKLVPVILAACELPISFTLVQGVDLSRWNERRDDRNWMRLTAMLHDLLAGSAQRAQDEELVTGFRSDWRAKYGAHINGEPILDGKAVTRAAPAGTLFKDGAELPLMCVVEGGRFTMGAPNSEPDSQVSERPLRQVNVSGPFALGVYVVTFDELDAAARAGGWSQSARDDGHGRGTMPAIHVSWSDAQALLQLLSHLSGERYRLPSEAEWEFACRAGSPDAYAFGTSCDTSQAHFAARAPAPVGRYPPNRFGLHDMHGNVREWVEDRWHDSYADAPSDSIPWTTGHSNMRVVRGGSWMDSAKYLRAASRGRAPETERCGFIGVRVARDIS